MIKGQKHSEDSKKKMSLSLLGRVSAMKGKHHSEFAKIKIGLFNKGKKLSKETKKKISEKLKGRIFTIETRKKLSDARKGINNRINYKHSEKTKEKIRIGNKGKKLSDEHRKKMSLLMKGRVSGNKGKKASEESRKKMSESNIRYKQNNKGKFKDTKPELAVEQILKNSNIEYTKQFRLSNRLYDFYLPKYNLLIEVDGIYWHGKNIKDEDLKYDVQKQKRKIDKLKNKLAVDNNYNLLRVWEDEIEEKEIIEKINLLDNQ